LDTTAADAALTEARQGSREALGRLMAECQNYLMLVANRELSDDLRAKAGASDIVQETFLEAQRDFPRFEGASVGDFRLWLRRLLVNNMANEARRFRQTGKRALDREILLDANPNDAANLMLHDDGPSPSRILIDAEEQAELLAALDKLPNHYRDAILMRHRDGLGYAEIGKALGRTPEAARKLWARGVELLQELLEGQEPRVATAD
jgi:RNA polymerase sigma-70 factor (ECF subfamily)